MQQRDLEQQLRFGLAARQLHRGHRLVHAREPEPRARRLAVDRQPRGAVAGRRAERALAERGAAPRAVRPRRRELGGEAPRPQRAPSSAWPAACACSRAAAVSASRVPSASQRLRAGAAPRRPAAPTASRRYRRSAVSTWSLRERPRCTRAAGGADARGQAPLERGLAILVLELDVPGAARVLGAERRRAPLADRRQVRSRQQLLRVQHLGVRDARRARRRRTSRSSSA